MQFSPPPDMQSSHHGVGPWWLGPLWTPQLPPDWDIAAQFRGVLRYSFAGVVEGSFLATVAVVSLAVGSPLRGLSILLLGIGAPMWVVSSVALIPRRHRPLLLEYAIKNPGLYEWFRLAIAREDTRMARRMVRLHLGLFLVCIASALLAGSATGPWFMLPLAIVAFVIAAFAVVLFLRLNSAGVRGSPASLA